MLAQNGSRSTVVMSVQAVPIGDRTIEGVAMVRHHYRVASIALTLALAAAAPAAARVELNPATGPDNQSTTASFAGVGHARHVPATTLAPSPGSRQVPPKIVATRGGAIQVPPTTVKSPAGARHVSATTPASSNAGFDWDDAGIGAGGAVALMTLLVGGAVGVSGVRRRATRSTV